MAYKYFHKAFYNKINKIEYDLQIWKHNICHKNTIVMKNVIILKKVIEKKELLISILDTAALVKIFQTSSFINFTGNISG